MRKSDLYCDIIVEGMDNTGKTTLIEKLKAVLPECYEVIKSPGATCEDQIAWIEKQLDNPNPILFDRHAIVSEEIYGQVLRGKSQLEKEFPRLLDRIINQRQAIFIYCRPSSFVITSTFKSREQMEGVAENIDKLIRGYDTYFKVVGQILNYTVYDFKADPDAVQLISSMKLPPKGLTDDELYRLGMQIRNGGMN